MGDNCGGTEMDEKSKVVFDWIQEVLLDRWGWWEAMHIWCWGERLARYGF